MSGEAYSHPPQFAGRYEGCVLDSEGNCSRWNHEHAPAVAADPSNLLRTERDDHQNALEMSRKAEQAERRAEDAEAAIEATRDLLDGWEHDGPDDYAIRLLIRRVREILALRERFRTDRDA